MLLSRLEINNFRGIKSLSIDFDGLTILIGENNSGKSTVLDAIRIALSPGLGSRRGRQFTEYDFHLGDENACPQNCESILIKVYLSERNPGEWAEEIIQQLDEVVQTALETGLGSIILQIQGVFNEELGDIETTYDFLNLQGSALPRKNSSPLSIINRIVPLFFLSALRNANDEFSKKGQFWNSFLKTIQLPDDDRKKLEEELSRINNDIVSSNDGFIQVKEHIRKASKFVTLSSEESVVLEALPTRLFDMTGKVQVHLKSPLGATLPLYRHGEGTQSLAVLLLFQAFAAANLKEIYLPHSTPILALEEPEAHLHPSAIRAFGDFFKDLPGQTMVASHSGDLLSRVSIPAVRRLYKNGADTFVGKVMLAPAGMRTDAIPPGTTLLFPEDLQAIDYHIRLTRGAYLFSRCWLLVEGKTEFHLFPLIGELLGFSQDASSYSVLELSQAEQKGEPFIKLAKSLGIQWFVLGDGDSDGSDYVTRAQKYLEPTESPDSRTKQLSQLTVEHEFWHNGFEDFIKNLLSDSLKREAIRDAAGDNDKLVKNMIKRAITVSGEKPGFALQLFDEIKRRGVDSLPTSIKDMFDKVKALL